MKKQLTFLLATAVFAFSPAFAADADHQETQDVSVTRTSNAFAYSSSTITKDGGTAVYSSTSTRFTIPQNLSPEQQAKLEAYMARKASLAAANADQPK